MPRILPGPLLKESFRKGTFTYVSETGRRVDEPLSLRALAHPARVALIDALAVRGPMTATEAAQWVGESPSNCSFHLRQLAKFGFVVEAGSSDGRRRPWKIVDGGIDVASPGAPDPEFSAAGALLEELFDARRSRAMAEWRARAPHEPPQWQEAAIGVFTVSWLTVDELNALRARVLELIDSHRGRRDPAGRPPGARPVRLYLSAFPAQ